jgi:hypothetical protein
MHASALPAMVPGMPGHAPGVLHPRKVAASHTRALAKGHRHTSNNGTTDHLQLWERVRGQALRQARLLVQGLACCQVRVSLCRHHQRRCRESSRRIACSRKSATSLVQFRGQELLQQCWGGARPQVPPKRWWGTTAGPSKAGLTQHVSAGHPILEHDHTRRNLHRHGHRRVQEH